MAPDVGALWVTAGLLLAIAVGSDLARRRIPNALCLIIAALGLGVAAGLHGVEGLRFAAGGMIGGALVFLPFYLLGGMGAGDTKLMASLGAWLGIHGAVLAAALALLAGAVMALWSLASRNPPRQLPFAPAIAAGAVMVVLLAAWPLTS